MRMKKTYVLLIFNVPNASPFQKRVFGWISQVIERAKQGKESEVCRYSKDAYPENHNWAEHISKIRINGNTDDSFVILYHGEDFQQFCNRVKTNNPGSNLKFLSMDMVAESIKETNPEIDNNLGVQKIEEKLNPLLTD